jgi:WD40 repeat protein
MPLGELKTFDKTLHNVEFSPEGKLVATIVSNEVRLWDLGADSPETIYEGESGKLSRLAGDSR